MEEGPVEAVVVPERKPRCSRPSGYWSRPHAKVYGYNFNLGEQYYKPLTSYLEKKDTGSVSEFPSHRSFAERLALFPLCGLAGGRGDGPCHHAAPAAPALDEEIPLFPRYRSKLLTEELGSADAPAPTETEAPTKRQKPTLEIPKLSVSDRILDVFGVNPETLRVKTPDDDVLYKEVDFHLFPFKGMDTGEDETAKARSKVSELEAEVEKLQSESASAKHSNVMSLADSCFKKESARKAEMTSEVATTTSVKIRSRKMKSTTEKETVSLVY